MDATAMVTLLQPSYETYCLFDNVIVLSRGQVAYQGPREEALQYFADLGYHCPPNINPAEFLRMATTSLLPTDSD